MIKRQKILITGALGFIGTRLVTRMLDKYELFIYDKKLGLSIFDDELEAYIKKSDIVIHLAALVSVPDSIKKPSETFYTNVIGTARVVELCVKHKKKLIYPSSAAVYDPESSPYAYSKKLAEDIVYGVRHKIPVVILRLFNVYGKDSNPKSSMYRFLHDSKITVNGDGQQVRDFINIDDVCSIMIDSIKKKWDGRIVDIGTGEGQLIEYIADTFRFYRQHKRIHYGPPVKGVRKSVADIRMMDFLYKEVLVTDVVRDIERMVKHDKEK